jgi:hypothetical protein
MNKWLGVMAIGLMALTCSRDPEGTKSGDCTDGKDNDYDGQIDCNDDGCSMFTSCQNALKKPSKLLSSQVRAAAKKAAETKDSAKSKE